MLGGESVSRVSLPPEVGDPPPLDTEAVEEGRALYGQYCASCHGGDLTGRAGWRIRNEDGSYLPPPHDSSGHTWHHSDQLLVSVIRDGWDDPLSQMPAFGGQLSDGEILAILEFFKSEWGPDERAYRWLVTAQDTGP